MQVYRNHDVEWDAVRLQIEKEARRGVLYSACYHSRAVRTDIPNAQLTVKKPMSKLPFLEIELSRRLCCFLFFESSACLFSICSNSNYLSLHINITLSEHYCLEISNRHGEALTARALSQLTFLYEGLILN